LSFFFTKTQPRHNALKAGRGTGLIKGAPSRGSKQNAATLARLGCEACPLNKAPGIVTRRMVPNIAKSTKIYFLAEAPGRDEDENSGEPLTGPSGKLLRDVIPNEFERYCSYDNIINCRPPKNRTPVWSEIECCRPRRVKWIEEAKPLLIVGLGAVPLHAMLGSTDMAGMRGRLFAIQIGNHKCWFLPTYHPSFVLRVAYNKAKPLNSKMGHCFRMDIKKAFDLIDDLKPPKVLTEQELREGIQCFDGADRFEELMELLRQTKKAKIKVVDIETKGLRPYRSDAAIMTAAFSFENTHFAFALDHPKTKWSKSQKEQILDQTESILKDDTIKVAHNAPYEIEWFAWLLGKEVVNHTAWHCTQMQAHFLDERRGKQHGKDDQDKRAAYQALNFLIKQHFGLAYKSLFKLNKKDMSLSPLGETLIYNACDTKTTLKLYHRQTRLLKRAGLYEAYLEALPRQPTVALMQHFGINVDQKEVKKAQHKLKGEIEELLLKINDLKVVKAYIRDHKEFNPDSGDHVVSIFKDYLKCPQVTIQDKDNVRYSVDKNILDTIDHPLAPLMIRYRNRTKLKSTYVDSLEMGVGEFVYPDGAIHCNFNTTFAETGRTSSDSPNMQNAPQRNDSWVRNLVAAKDGYVIVAFDYGQLEGCTGAICSKDKLLIKYLWDDYDMHMEWAQKLAHLYPAIAGGKNGIKDPDVMKKLRSRVKNKLVFPAWFGAANESIAGYLGMEDHLPIIETLMDEFWATFDDTHKWQDKLMTKYYEVGWVESPTHRRHHYPLTRNQVVNFPVQSVACDIVCDAMNTLSFMAKEENKWHLHPILNIHDDLSFIMPNDDRILEPAIETIYKIMLTPPYKFINVPLSVTCSVGKHWYKMQEVGKFWSHKDV